MWCWTQWLHHWIEYIKGIKKTLVYVLSWLIHLDLTKPNVSEKEGQTYGYAAFEPLPDINSGNKCTPVLLVAGTSLDVKDLNNVTKNQNEYAKTHLLLSTAKLRCKMMIFSIEI